MTATKLRLRAIPGIRAITDAGTSAARLLLGAGAALAFSTAVTLAADYPAPKEANFVAQIGRAHV